MVLAKRIKEEIEGKGAIPHNQTGFRKRMGIMDKIYVLNSLANRQLGKKKAIIAMFVDLKAAFDSVDRSILIKAMREQRLMERLVVRVEEVMRETRSRIRVEGKDRRFLDG